MVVYNFDTQNKRLPNYHLVIKNLKKRGNWNIRSRTKTPNYYLANDLGPHDGRTLHSAITNRVEKIEDIMGDKFIFASRINANSDLKPFLPRSTTLVAGPSQLHKIDKFVRQNPDIKFWILKEGIGAQGQQVYIYENINEVINHVRKAPRDIRYQLSEYINNPMLTKLSGQYTKGSQVFNDTIGRKNSMRVYILITQDPTSGLRVWIWYNQYIYFASEEYNYNKRNKDSDITNLYNGKLNYKRKKLNPEHAYTDFSHIAQNIVDAKYGKGTYNSRVLPKIKKIIVDIFKEFKPDLQCMNCKSSNFKACYHLNALDLMLDDQLKPIIMEFNTSPGIKSMYVDPLDFYNSIFELAIDPYFPPAKTNKNMNGFIRIM